MEGGRTTEGLSDYIPGNGVVLSCLQPPYDCLKTPSRGRSLVSNWLAVRVVSTITLERTNKYQGRRHQAFLSNRNLPADKTSIVQCGYTWL